MEIPDIINSIGDDIEIESRPVDPGLSNLGQVKRTDTEDNVPGEGKIIYDIRFTAYHLQDEIKFLINLEAQKSSDPKKLGYHLENRIIFYLARMISAQKQTEFFHSDYDSLKRVRSIWICQGNEEDGDSIEEIGLDKKTVYGNPESTYGTDLVKGIIINIRNRENVKSSQNILISMLEDLISQTDIEQKKRILTEEYGMIMTTELEGRIQTMCNWSENIRDTAIQKGIEEERLNAIERMLRANATKEQIISFGYTEAEIATVENALLINS